MCWVCGPDHPSPHDPPAVEPCPTLTQDRRTLAQEVNFCSADPFDDSAGARRRVRGTVGLRAAADRGRSRGAGRGLAVHGRGGAGRGAGYLPGTVLRRCPDPPPMGTHGRALCRGNEPPQYRRGAGAARSVQRSRGTHRGQPDRHPPGLQSGQHRFRHRPAATGRALGPADHRVAHGVERRGRARGARHGHGLGQP